MKILKFLAAFFLIFASNFNWVKSQMGNHYQLSPKKNSQTSDYGQVPPASSSLNQAKPTDYADFSNLPGSEGAQTPEASSYALPESQEVPSSDASSSLQGEHHPWNLPPKKSRPVSEYYGQMPPATSSPSSSLQQTPSKPTDYTDFSNLPGSEGAEAPSFADQAKLLQATPKEEPPAQVTEEAPSSSSSSSSSSSYSSSSSSETVSSVDINRFRENLRIFLNLPILENYTPAQILKMQMLKFKKWGCYRQLIAYIESHPQFQDLNLGVSKAASSQLTSQGEVNKIVGQLRLVVSKFEPKLSEEQEGLKEFAKATGAKIDEIDNYIQPGFITFLFKNKKDVQRAYNQYFLLQITQTVNQYSSPQKIEPSKDWKKMRSRLQNSLSQIREAYKVWEGKVKELKGDLRDLRNKIKNPSHKMSHKALGSLQDKEEEIIKKLVELEGKK